MRYFLHIFILFIFSVKGVSQENTTASIKIMGDSILKVYELKNDFDERLDILLSFTNFSGLEVY
jgi:hypothetical protein